MEELQELFVRGEKNFTIEYGGKKYEFAIKELSWIESNKILSKAVKIGQDGLKIQLDVWYEEYLVAALTKAPWKVPAETRVAIKQLNPVVGSKLEEFIPKPGAVEANADFFGGE